MSKQNYCEVLENQPAYAIDRGSLFCYHEITAPRVGRQASAGLFDGEYYEITD